jgi:surfeit locus 1 family protein
MKIKIHKWKLELVPLLVTITATISLIYLGNWQLQRLSEKEQFIANIEYNIANPAVSISEISSPIPLYSKVQISGHFLSDKNVHLYGRRTTSPEKDGYYLLSAFAADSGEIYLVSRGWLPHSAKNKIDTSSAETETIEGMTLPGEKKNLFVPANDLMNNIWFTLDLEMARHTLGVNVTDFYIMQTSSEYLPDGLLPLTTKNLSKVRNDHLEYAITWYSLAASLVIIFIIYSRKQNRKK